MNQRGETEFIPNAFVKVLLFLTILLAFLWGFNGILIGASLISLTQIFSVSVARIVDVIAGLSTVLIAILLFVRILKRD